MKLNQKGSLLIYLVLVLSVITVAGGYFFYFKDNKTELKKDNLPKETSQTSNPSIDEECAKPNDFDNKLGSTNNPLTTDIEQQLTESSNWPYQNPLIEYKFYKDFGFLNGDLTDGKLTKDWSTFIYNSLSFSKAKCIYKPGLPEIKVTQEILNGIKFYKVDGCCLDPRETYYLEIPANKITDENKFVVITIDYFHGETGGEGLKQKFLNVIKTIKFVDK